MMAHLEVGYRDGVEKGGRLSMARKHDDPQTLHCGSNQRASPGLGSAERGHDGLVQAVEIPPDRPVAMRRNAQGHRPAPQERGTRSTTLALQYCSVHQRAWVETLGQWGAFPESTMDGTPVTEVACDTCTVFVFQTFRAQFPALYSSGP
jgi:hypothetical protein